MLQATLYMETKKIRVKRMLLWWFGAGHFYICHVWVLAECADPAR